jgi:hypothetical protein
MDKVPKKRAPAKAKVIKKTNVDTGAVLSVKKVAPKRLLEKTDVTTLPTKAKAKPKAKLVKKLPVKKVTSRTKSDTDEVKLVPGTISLRLAEKRKLYERVYQDYVPKVMRPVAITSGYAYVTIGIFLAIFMANPAISNLVSQSASVLCFSGDCQLATTTPMEAKNQVLPVEFMPLAPIVPDVDTNLQLTLNLDVPVQILLLPISGGQTLTISGVTESASNIVNFLLPTATLNNGKYLVQAELYDRESKQVRAKLLGPTIVVENVVPEVVIPVEVIETPELPIDDTITPEGEVLGVSTTTAEALNETEDISDDESEELPADITVEELSVIEVVPVENSDVFDLTVIPGTTSTQSVLKILPTYVFDKVELAVKLKGDGETFYLGQATKADDIWYYWLEGTNIPNGTYSLIVRGFDNGELSEEATFAFTNMADSISTTKADREEIETRVNSLLEVGLDISELATLRASYATSYLEVSEVPYADDYLADYLPELDRLFARYASAVAGGNEALIILADEQIEKYLDAVIVEEDTNQVSTHELSALLLNTKEYIKTKEAEVIKLSGGDSAFDVDKDGLTDYDEVTIYNTDPKLPDTDYDGYLDSVEILSGYSADDAKLEAVSRIDDHVKFGVINGDLLVISAIEPFYFYSDANTSPDILTSVTGKGVPNSFARLYLGEDIDAVLVKVDAEGNFTQTIDKDFVQIEGEVVLAVTDNTGKIVMRGQPLQLDKVVTSKQLFNPTAIDAAVIKSVEEFTTSNIIGALGVVSFGLILLLLGKALVPRREPVSLEIA